MSDQYYLPQATARLLTPDGLPQCKNLGLILDKYAPRTAVDKSEGKSTWLKAFETDTHIDTRLAEQVYERWRRATVAMQAEHFSAKTDRRMVVGLGGETVLETDLTLHYLYGIPFIPGSALKGLTRAYVTGEVAGHKSKKIDLDDPEVQRVFGTQKDAGSVIFFDAMPVNGKVELDLDIMNAHYPQYYGQQQLPTNDQDPNPVTFLTVTQTTFMFALAPRRPKHAKDADDVKLAMQWLQMALQEYGVGGKTSAGYGFFSSPQQEVAAAESASIPYSRPNIPKFTVGLSILGSVVAATDERRRLVPDAKAFLQYRDFPTSNVLIVVQAEEAANWTSGQTRNCLFEREEERSGCTLLICQPSINKQKNKKR
jgi:CRISPR type III-B/RAMP module RAMP protein Cmr6